MARVLPDDPGAMALLRQRIDDAVTEGHERIVLDLRASGLGSPTAMSAFCVALRRLDRRGLALVLVGLAPNLRRIVQLCEIEGVEIAPRG